MNPDEEKKKLGLGDDIPMFDVNDKDFKEQFEFALWSTNSCSDYRNDRARPYNGQIHTDDGIRGSQIVEGLTMRDIKDCLIKAMLMSAPCEKYLEADTFTKCWDYSTDPPTPTQFLLDRQNEPDFVSTKAQTGNWRPQDVYKIDFTKVDPIAIAQNLTCEIERLMGIFPNVPELKEV